MSVTGNANVFLVGELHFDSLEAIKIAFASNEGIACAADRKTFALNDDKVEMYLFDTTEV